MTPAQRLAQASALSSNVLQLALADIRRRHPRASEREVQMRLAARTLDPQLVRKAFGWDPDVTGY
jgi:hypothetical protein